MNNKFTKNTFLFIPIFLATIFICGLVLSFFIVNYNSNLKLSNFNNLSNQIISDNNTYKNIINSGKNTQIKQEPLFKNSKDAIIAAAQSINTRNSLYMKSFGKVKTVAFGATIIVESDLDSWKWSNTESLQVLEKYQTSGLNMNQTGGSSSYINGNKTYKRKAKSVYKNGKEYSANYSDVLWQSSTPEKLELLTYTFNKNSIINVGELVIYYNSDGTINYYAVDFNLHTTIGVQKYATTIMKNTNGLAKEPPVFSEVKMRMEIDNTGNLTTLYSFEKCVLSIGVKANVTNEFTYEFKPIENAPVIEKPKI